MMDEERSEGTRWKERTGGRNGSEEVMDEERRKSSVERRNRWEEGKSGNSVRWRVG